MSTPVGRRREGSETGGSQCLRFCFCAGSPHLDCFFLWPSDLHCKWSREREGHIGHRALGDGAVESVFQAPHLHAPGQVPTVLPVSSRQPSPSMSASYWKIRKDMSPALVLPTCYHLAAPQDFMTNRNE